MRRILSIDGGGIKGIIPAVVCAEMERRAARPLHSAFSMIAGTSTGAIIAAALGVGLDADTIVELYRHEGPRIFRDPRWLPVQLWKAKYRKNRLLSVLRDYLGTAVLGDAQTHVMTTAYDVSGNWDEAGNPGPVFFKSWREELTEIPLADAVYASAAAPSYFPPHHVPVPWKKNVEACLYDGALYAGDPAMCGYAEAAGLWAGEEIQVVSLGTGTLEQRTDCSKASGLINLAQNVHGWMLDGSMDTVPYIARRVLAHYVRLDANLERPVRLDDASDRNLRTLSDAAERLIETNDDVLSRVVT